MLDGKNFRVAALHNVPPAYAERRAQAGASTAPEAGLNTVLETKQIVAYSRCRGRAGLRRQPRLITLARARTLVVVPMLKDNEVIGAINVYRTEVRPFTDKQIELVSNFAAQAVIAIENTRLLNELRQRTDDLTESLEQQTATSEVLQIISSSPGELGPVFKSMLENATRICGATCGNMFLVRGRRLPDGRTARRATGLGGAARAAAGRQTRPKRSAGAPDGNQAGGADCRRHKDPAYDDRDPTFVGLVELGGARTLLVVPMLKENELVGAIAIYRQEVRPFTDKQIELVTNFAAQAVIAIENTRLLNELRQRTDDLSESLEQQTATSEVLQRHLKLTR